MNKLLQFALLCACFLLSISNSRAQSTLIHYWNFNTLAGPYIHPNIPHIMPDYPSGDTGYLEYYLLPGTSATWAISGPDANNASGAQIDNVAGDTTNARLGDPAATGIRFRNPTDSAELHWHIPSTGFSNLVVKFATQTSSVASGDSVQDYSYSVDGGKTWDSTGMTVNGAPGHTLDLTQGGSATTIYLNFSPVTVTFGSATTVNNNPNLIFRIIFQGNTHPGFPVTGTAQVSGNNRFDNFTVDGTPMAVVPTLIHYWNFNTLAGPYIHPNIPHIMPDYPSGDTGYLEYYLLPGTSATWAISGPDANNASGAQVDNVAGDTTNARLGDPAGTGIRFRNPTDSAELHWHIPSTGFSNLVVKFATQTSSVASGDSVQDYSYSVDGGKTWDSTGMTVNGAPGHTLDLTQGGSATTIYLNFSPVTVTFGSATTVNNNPNLIFRIIFQGNTHPGFPVTGTAQVSGNNRFDNFTVDGVGGSGPPPPPPAKITMKTPSPGGGNIFVPGQKTLVSFHPVSVVGQARKVQFSSDSGKTWTLVATVTDPGDTTYTWTVPNTPTTKGLISVYDSANVTGVAGPFIIYQVPSNNLIVDYWAFNTLSGAYYTPNVPNLPADFTAPGTPQGYIQYVNFAKIANWSYIDNVAGDAAYAHLGAPAGNGLRVRNPTDSMELHFVIPTTGFKGISISYALQASSTTGPQVEHFTYSTDGGTHWITTGITVNGSAQDTLDVTQSQYQQSAAPGAPYGPVTIGFGSQTSIDNNPNFVFRIVFGDTATGGTSGNNRFDNITVNASASAGVNQPAGRSLECYAFPSPTQDHITILCPEQGRKSISITDIVGHAIANFSESQEQYNYDVRDLTSGTYFIHIQAMSGEQATLRFVKE